jgi:hypothetical protein
VTYEYGATNTWTVTPCGAGCANIAVKPETESVAGVEVGQPYTQQAHLKGDTWSLAYLQIDGYVCPDGTETAMDAIQSWNVTTLKGTFDTWFHGPGCGKPDGFRTGPTESFTLVKVS